MKKNKKETYTSKVSVFTFIKNVLSWTLFSLLFIIAVALVYYVIANYRYSKKGPGYEPAFSLFTIISPSMKPTINVYDVIVDTPIKDPSKVKVGDIITFVSSSSISKGYTVTHRVSGITVIDGKYEFSTKGDNNATEDTARVKEEDLLGMVRFRIPQLGRLQSFISSRGGWLLCILIPAVIILITDIIKIIRMIRVKDKIDDINKLDDNTINEEQISNNKKLKKVLKEKHNDELTDVFIDLDNIEMELPKLKDE